MNTNTQLGLRDVLPEMPWWTTSNELMKTSIKWVVWNWMKTLFKCVLCNGQSMQDLLTSPQKLCPNRRVEGLANSKFLHMSLMISLWRSEWVFLPSTKYFVDLLHGFRSLLELIKCLLENIKWWSAPPGRYCHQICWSHINRSPKPQSILGLGQLLCVFLWQK